MPILGGYCDSFGCFFIAKEGCAMKYPLAFILTLFFAVNAFAQEPKRTGFIGVTSQQKMDSPQIGRHALADNAWVCPTTLLPKYISGVIGCTPTGRDTLNGFKWEYGGVNLGINFDKNGISVNLHPR